MSVYAAAEVDADYDHVGGELVLRIHDPHIAQYLADVLADEWKRSGGHGAREISETITAAMQP